MRFIKQDSTGAWTLDEYIRYVDTIKSKLSSDALALAGIERIDFFSLKSLHDADFSGFAVGFEKPLEGKGVRVEIYLTAPSGIRTMKIQYHDVLEYQIGNIQYYHDLLVHELTLGDEGELVHEILFSNGRVIKIRARDLSFTERTNNRRKKTKRNEK